MSQPSVTLPRPAPRADLEEFRRVGHEMIDWIASYLETIEQYPVLAQVEPGQFRQSLPTTPPEAAEPLDRIWADFRKLVVPATTHWNHPGFLAYFANTGSPPGILAELLTAALNANAMVWRTGPAATELEEVTCDWLRQLLGLHPEFDGTINDTASTSTFYALAAAREKLSGLNVREAGLAARAEVPQLRVYCSDEAHSSVDKAVITLGLGLFGIRRIRTRPDYTMDTEALKQAIADDLQAGNRPVAVIATVGTTSTTAIDSVAAIGAICAEQDIWLHVDAAYAGSAAILPEMRWIFDGNERADSIVINPHKWLLVPMDCSILYTRRPELLRAAFSLKTPDYLTTRERARNLMDYGVSLGRRFRALKLWFVLRAYGAEGVRAMLREHIRLARLFADWIDADPDFERLAPTRFSVVVFRHVPPALRGNESGLAEHNLALLERLNKGGEVFLSQTRAKGRAGLRLAIGNEQTAEPHVRRAWELLQQEAARRALT